MHAILADHGADVIKVEPPAGDETRDWGRPSMRTDAAYFVGINRNKRSIGLDLASEGGRAVLMKLLEGADVLIENFKPGTLDLPITKAAYDKAKEEGAGAGLPRDAAEGADQQGADRELAGASARQHGAAARRLVEEIEQALAGKKTAKQALDAAVERGNAMLRQFEKTAVH